MADSLLSDDQSERQVILNKWKDKDPQQVLEAKVESDLYVKTLTARFDDLKKDYLELRERQQASEDLKTLIDQMKQKQNDTNLDTQRKVETHAIKQEEIEALMEAKLLEKLNQRDLVTKQRQNFDVVEQKLKEVYGTDYQPHYQKKLDELGLDKSFADDLAKNHPSVFIKTFELDVRHTQPNVVPKSTIRNTTFSPSTPKRDWNYYQELKKANPKLYLDPKIANQMHDDAIALGVDFGLPE